MRPRVSPGRLRISIYSSQTYLHKLNTIWFCFISQAIDVNPSSTGVRVVPWPLAYKHVQQIDIYIRTKHFIFIFSLQKTLLCLLSQGTDVNASSSGVRVLPWPLADALGVPHRHIYILSTYIRTEHFILLFSLLASQGINVNASNSGVRVLPWPLAGALGVPALARPSVHVPVSQVSYIYIYICTPIYQFV